MAPPSGGKKTRSGVTCGAAEGIGWEDDPPEDAAAEGDALLESVLGDVASLDDEAREPIKKMAGSHARSGRTGDRSADILLLAQLTDALREKSHVSTQRGGDRARLLGAKEAFEERTRAAASKKLSAASSKKFVAAAKADPLSHVRMSSVPCEGGLTCEEDWDMLEVMVIKQQRSGVASSAALMVALAMEIAEARGAPLKRKPSKAWVREALMPWVRRKGARRALTKAADQKRAPRRMRSAPSA